MCLSVGFVRSLNFFFILIFCAHKDINLWEQGERSILFLWALCDMEEVSPGRFYWSSFFIF